MTEQDRIVAVSLLTEQELTAVGQGLKHVYPIGADHPFNDLLRAIDLAEQAHPHPIIPVRRS